MTTRGTGVEAALRRSFGALARGAIRAGRQLAPALVALAAAIAPAGPARAAEPRLSMAECRSALAVVPGLAGDRMVQPRSPRRPLIGLGSGPRGQTYHEMADNLIDLLADFGGVSLVNVETGGSSVNLDLLDSSTFNMTLAFAQSDVLARASALQRSRLRVVMPLYLEEVHVLARRGHATLAALEARRIAVSSQSTGSAYTARRLLKLAGITPQGGDIALLSPVEAVCQVLTGDADAMVVVSGQPVRLFADLERLRYHPAQPLQTVHFLPLQPGDLTRGGQPESEAAFYEAAGIEPSSYPWAFESRKGTGPGAVATLAVRALLMAFDFSTGSGPNMVSSCDTLKAVTRALRDRANQTRLCQVPNHPKWCQLAAPRTFVPGWQPNTCV